MFKMFQNSAKIYDAVYSFKDYARECKQIAALIETFKQSPGNELLDVACGTGQHISLLKETYQVEGVDLLPEFLDLARKKNPEITFHQGDMSSFALNKQFDIVTCLFSAIGYMLTQEKLNSAIACMKAHLKPGGVLLLEPWFTPTTFFPGKLHALTVDQPEIKVARMNISQVEPGEISILDFHYMIGTPERIEYFNERHELKLFTQDEYRQALESQGLNVTYDATGLMDRGLYIGVRDLSMQD